MLRNYFTIALRGFLKNKDFSFINIAGLSIGLAGVITIVAYVKLELSYDRFHADADNIYRITTNQLNDGAQEHSAQNASALAPILNESLAGLEKAVRIFPHSGLVSIDKQNKVRESKFCFVDSTFFEVFSFRVREGSIAQALHRPLSLVITESAAIRYFGSSSVVGKELFFEDTRKTSGFNIAAVIEDMPQNAHFKFDFMASYSSLQSLWPNAMANWHYPPVYLYLKVNEGKSIESINEQLKTIAQTHLPDYVKEEKRTFLAQKITDIHLYSSLQNEWEANSSYSFVKMFSLVAALILSIACINYMNLATAKSLQRTAEVGIRKTLGSARLQLMRMFLSESLVMTSIALIIAIPLAQFVSAMFFKDFLHKELSFEFLYQEMGFLYLVVGVLLISLLAGLYPALYMSSFKPIKALKGKVDATGSVLGLRKGLVVFQFSISALLLIGSFVVIRQIDFMRNKNLGFDEEHILTITLSDRLSQQNYLTLKDKLLQESFVENVTVSATLPAGEGFYDWEIVPEGFEDQKDIVLKSVNTDEDFITTYQIKMLAGRDFSKDIITDKEQAFILNKAAAKKFGWSDPVGKEFQLTFHTNDAVVRKGKVIGIVEDFHYQSLYSKIEPLVIFINTHPYYTDYLSLRLSPGNINEQIKKLESVWNSFNPDKPFEFSFLDNDLDKLYKSEQRTSSLLTVFTGLSVLISCLGLFGLASFSVQQRTKEIGIRKVLGASVFNILKLVTKEFVWLVAIANIVAWPLAWYSANQWLDKFAYRIDMEITILIITAVIILMIAIVTVGIKATKSALMNPVKSLRYE
jgi:putative ABC transport system permease protein